jgi:hypothetical protein
MRPIVACELRNTLHKDAFRVISRRTVMNNMGGT